MPKTKFQEFVYGVLMTFFMVLAMELQHRPAHRRAHQRRPAACPA